MVWKVIGAGTMELGKLGEWNEVLFVGGVTGGLVEIALRVDGLKTKVCS